MTRSAEAQDGNRERPRTKKPAEDPATERARLEREDEGKVDEVEDEIKKIKLAPVTKKERKELKIGAADDTLEEFAKQKYEAEEARRIARETQEKKERARIRAQERRDRIKRLREEQAALAARFEKAGVNPESDVQALEQIEALQAQIDAQREGETAVSEVSPISRIGKRLDEDRTSQVDQDVDVNDDTTSGSSEPLRDLANEERYSEQPVAPSTGWAAVDHENNGDVEARGDVPHDRFAQVPFEDATHATDTQASILEPTADEVEVQVNPVTGEVTPVVGEILDAEALPARANSAESLPVIDVTAEPVGDASDEDVINLDESEIVSPVIKKPSDARLVRQLEAKLGEYRARLKTEKRDPYKAPEQLSMDTRYKIMVLEALLTDGQVDTHELSRKIQEQDGFVNGPDFENACGVIESYCTEAGEGNVGGTGLADLEESQAVAAPAAPQTNDAQPAPAPAAQHQSLGEAAVAGINDVFDDREVRNAIPVSHTERGGFRVALQSERGIEGRDRSMKALNAHLESVREEMRTLRLRRREIENKGRLSRSATDITNLALIPAQIRKLEDEQRRVQDQIKALRNPQAPAARTPEAAASVELGPDADKAVARIKELKNEWGRLMAHPVSEVDFYAKSEAVRKEIKEVARAAVKPMQEQLKTLKKQDADMEATPGKRFELGQRREIAGKIKQLEAQIKAVQDAAAAEAPVHEPEQVPIPEPRAKAARTSEAAQEQPKDLQTLLSISGKELRGVDIDRIAKLRKEKNKDGNISAKDRLDEALATLETMQEKSKTYMDIDGDLHAFKQQLAQEVQTLEATLKREQEQATKEAGKEAGARAKLEADLVRRAQEAERKHAKRTAEQAKQERKEADARAKQERKEATARAKREAQEAAANAPKVRGIMGRGIDKLGAMKSRLDHIRENRDRIKAKESKLEEHIEGLGKERNALVAEKKRVSTPWKLAKDFVLRGTQYEAGGIEARKQEIDTKLAAIDVELKASEAELARIAKINAFELAVNASVTKPRTETPEAPAAEVTSSPAPAASTRGRERSGGESRSETTPEQPNEAPAQAIGKMDEGELLGRAQKLREKMKSTPSGRDRLPLLKDLREAEKEIEKRGQMPEGVEEGEHADKSVIDAKKVKGMTIEQIENGFHHIERQGFVDARSMAFADEVMRRMLRDDPAAGAHLSDIASDEKIEELGARALKLMKGSPKRYLGEIDRMSGGDKGEMVVHLERYRRLGHELEAKMKEMKEGSSTDEQAAEKAPAA